MSSTATVPLRQGFWKETVDAQEFDYVVNVWFPQAPIDVLLESQDRVEMPASSETQELRRPDPKTIHIRTLGDVSLELLCTLPITVEHWTDHVSAWSFDLDEYGIGSDEHSAIEDLRRSVVELYWLLKGERAAGAFGPLLERQWRILEQFVKER